MHVIVGGDRVNALTNGCLLDGSGLITHLNNEKPVICVFSVQGGGSGTFFVVYKGDPAIYRYAWSLSVSGSSSLFLLLLNIFLTN